MGMADSSGYVNVAGLKFQVLAARYAVDLNDPNRVMNLCILCKERDDLSSDHVFGDCYSRFDFEFPRAAVSGVTSNFAIDFNRSVHGEHCMVYFGEHMFIPKVTGELEISDSKAKLVASGEIEYDDCCIEFEVVCFPEKSSSDRVNDLFRQDFPL